MDVRSILSPRAQDVRDLLDLLIQEMVDHPEALRVVALAGGATCLFEIYADQEDIRRIIGRKGRTADAIRGLLTNLGARDDRRYLISIIEPDGKCPLGVTQAQLPIPDQASAGDRIEMLLLLLVRQLVDEPETVRIRTTRGQAMTILEISAAQQELRKIIGRKGRTANILRDLMTAVGGRHGLNVLVDVLELETLSRLGEG